MITIPLYSLSLNVAELFIGSIKSKLKQQQKNSQEDKVP